MGRVGLGVWLVFALLAAGGPAGTGAATRRGGPPPHASVPLYLALGDSLATGVGASDPDRTAYVPLFHGYLRENLDCGRGQARGCSRLRLQNLGQSGATTATLLRDQLPLALGVLAARNGNANPRDDVEVVTVDIGGNDAFALGRPCETGVTPGCARAIRATFAAIAENLAAALSQLRTAAGPETEIVVMTYYNALVGCDRADLAPRAALLLEGGLGLPAGLNDVIRSAAEPADAEVAETYGLLGPGDLVGGTDCLHPVDSGHLLIAGAFAAASSA